MNGLDDGLRDAQPRARSVLFDVPRSATDWVTDQRVNGIRVVPPVLLTTVIITVVPGLAA